MSERPSRVFISLDYEKAEYGHSWRNEQGPNAAVSLSRDLEITFKSSDHADALAAACLKAAEELRQLEATQPKTKPDCPACFGTGLVHAGKSRSEVCGLCFPEGTGHVDG